MSLDGVSGSLRPYQREALRAMAQTRARRFIVSLPTGTGKTLVAAHHVKAHYYDKRLRVVWIAHTEELLDQAVDHLVRVGIPVHHLCCHYAGRKEEHLKFGARIWLLNNAVTEGGPDSADLIVIDEAHHAAAPTYTKRLSALRAYANDGPRVLGLTATPYRLHEGEVEPLTKFGFSKPRVPIFEEVVYRKSFCELAAVGYVAPFRHVEQRTQQRYRLERSQVTGDFSGSSLNLLNNKARNRLVVDNWSQRRQEYGKTLVFVGTQEHARDLAKAFGDCARSLVSGDGSSREERESVVDDFRRGRFQVLVNVAIFKEGVDVPDIQTVILARPTTSPGMFTQMIGRGSRVLPNKRFFYLIDVHDQLEKYEDYLVGVNDLADRTPELLEPVRQRARAAERINSLRMRSLVQDRATLVYLLARRGAEVIREFVGWVAFERPGGTAVPLAALLTRQDWELLLLASRCQRRLDPPDADRVMQAWNANRTGAVLKCARALHDGLVGFMYEFDPSSAQDLEVIASEGPVALGLPTEAAYGAVHQLLMALESWARSADVPESNLAFVTEEYMATPTRFGSVLRLGVQGQTPHLRLVSPEAWSVIGAAAERHRAGTLATESIPELLAGLVDMEPDLLTRQHEVLDCIMRAAKSEPTTFILPQQPSATQTTPTPSTRPAW